MNMQGITAMLITNALAPQARRSHSPIEAIAATGPGGLGKTAKNLVAFKIMDAFLEAYQRELPRRYPYKAPPLPPSPKAHDLAPPSPFHTYQQSVKDGKFVVAKASMSDAAEAMIQLIG